MYCQNCKEIKNIQISNSPLRSVDLLLSGMGKLSNIVIVNCHKKTNFRFFVQRFTTKSTNLHVDTYKHLCRKTATQTRVYNDYDEYTLYPNFVTGNRDTWIRRILKKGHNSGTIWPGPMKTMPCTSTRHRDHV